MMNNCQQLEHTCSCFDDFAECELCDLQRTARPKIVYSQEDTRLMNTLLEYYKLIEKMSYSYGYLTTQWKRDESELLKILRESLTDEIKDIHFFGQNGELVITMDDVILNGVSVKKYNTSGAHNYFALRAQNIPGVDVSDTPLGKAILDEHFKEFDADRAQMGEDLE
jgi:hypothetical protein